MGKMSGAMAAQTPYKQALANLWEFSEKIDFAAAPFLTFLIDKAHGVPAPSSKIIPFFKMYNLQLREKYEYVYVNPWMRQPYKNQVSCVNTIEYLQQPRGFGCWNGQDVKANCDNYQCKYHPIMANISVPCNLMREAIWKRDTPAGQLTFGKNYVSIIKKQILFNKKIPLKDLLTVLYRDSSHNLQTLFEKFEMEFSLTSEEIEAFFSPLGEMYKSVNLIQESESPREMTYDLPNTVNEDLNIRHLIQNHGLSNEDLLDQLQAFAIENGRVPTIEDPGMKDVIRAAGQHFGSLENAFIVAGLSVQRPFGVANSPQDRKREPETLIDLMVNLLDNNPMDYTTICNKVGSVSGFGSANKTTIWAAMQRCSSIRSIGSRRSKIYFIVGQEELAIEKMTRKTAEADDQIKPLTSIGQENTNTKSSWDSLSDAITILLKEKPMTLKELKVRIQGIPYFDKTDTLLLLMTIYNMKNIKTSQTEAKIDIYSIEESKPTACIDTEKNADSLIIPSKNNLTNENCQEIKKRDNIEAASKITYNEKCNFLKNANCPIGKLRKGPFTEERAGLEKTGETVTTNDGQIDKDILVYNRLSEREKEIEILEEEIKKLLSAKPMSLKNIKENLYDSGNFHYASYKNILIAIRSSEHIKRSYSLGVESYYLQRESELHSPINEQLDPNSNNTQSDLERRIRQDCKQISISLKDGQTEELAIANISDAKTDNPEKERQDICEEKVEQQISTGQIVEIDTVESHDGLRPNQESNSNISQVRPDQIKPERDNSSLAYKLRKFLTGNP